MSDHALVIGCDAYPHVTNGDLRGAVADALAVRTWLLDPAGGNVDDSELVFLASASAGGAHPAAKIIHGPASVDTVAQEVTRLVDRSHIETDRLYVYFAGHGCQTDPHNAALSQDALALTDFSPSNPASGCVGVSDLLTHLEQSWFGTILVFLDACRNFPFDRPFRLGGLGFDPRLRESGQGVPHIYLGQATVPGGTASATSVAGIISGEFTRALLDGLHGTGTAKVFDETAYSAPYIVRWTSLFEYVKAMVPHARLRGDGDTVLCRFPDGHFDHVTLQVDIDPTDLSHAPDLRVDVRYPDLQTVDDGHLHGPGPAPVEFRVPPRRHRVSAAAAGRHHKISFDVYDELTLVRLGLWPTIRIGPVEQTPEIPRHLIQSDGTVHGELNASVSDHLAALEVRNMGGSLMCRGVGAVKPTLQPGPYTVTLIDPDGHDVTKVADVEPGKVHHFYVSKRPRDVTLRDFIPIYDESVWYYNNTMVHLASGAAQTVLNTANLAPIEHPVVVVINPKPLPPATVPPEIEQLNAPTDEFWSSPSSPASIAFPPRDIEWGWLTQLALEPTPAFVKMTLGNHTLTVPALPQTATGVFLDRDELIVGLFDRAILHHYQPEPDWHYLSPDWDRLLLQDRIQRYLGTGRPSAARAVFDMLTEQYPDDSLTNIEKILRSLIRETDPKTTPHPATAASVPPGLRYQLLGNSPWNVQNEAHGPLRVRATDR